MSYEDLQVVVERIAKLKRKAKDPACSPSESKACVNLANKLFKKHEHKILERLKPKHTRKPRKGWNKKRMADFVNGLMAKKPNDKAPDFVKCNLSIKREDLITWLSERKEEWINVQVKESGRTGNWYAEVDTWEPKSKA